MQFLFNAGLNQSDGGLYTKNRVRRHTPGKTERDVGRAQKAAKYGQRVNGKQVAFYPLASISKLYVI